ncbi:hypothetical protein UT300005_14770 [Clostridium sp. CTA-5]
MEVGCIFTLIRICALVCIIIYIYKAYRSRNRKDNINQCAKIRVINEELNHESGNFKISGNEDDFIIVKDDRFEFEVKNGIIISCKDIKRHKRFIKY